jgi:hypothetical protein
VSYVLFNLSSNDFYYLGVYKFIINFAFLISSLIYFNDMNFKDRRSFLSSFEKGVVAIISLNFIQIIASVAIGGLWLLPFEFANSEGAYAIQYSIPIIFGDENKNIWASKFLIVYLWALFFQKLGYFRVSKLMHALSFFIVLYTSSRTAQLALALTYLVLFFDAFICRYKNLLSFLILLCAVYSLIYFICPFIMNYDVASGHGGDGLFARIILWRHFLELAADMSVSEYFFGHGISAAEIYLSNLFQENNWHNVLINQFYAFGAVGVILFILALSGFFIKNSRGYVIGLPIALISASQYSGYEPELIISYSVLAFLASSNKH